MASVDLAAASLGAAAPVPVAQAVPAAPAERFAEILANLDGTRVATAEAEGASVAGAPSPAGPVPPTWDALEQIARQLTRSTAWTSSAATPRAMRKATADTTEPEAAPTRAADGAATPTPTMTVCVAPELALQMPCIDEGTDAAAPSMGAGAPPTRSSERTMPGEAFGNPETAVDPAVGTPTPFAGAPPDGAPETAGEPPPTPIRTEIAIPGPADLKAAGHTSVKDRKDPVSSAASAGTPGTANATPIGAALAASVGVEGGPRQDLSQGEGGPGERKADTDQPGVRMAPTRTAAPSPVNPKAFADRFRANESTGEGPGPVGTKFNSRPLDVPPAHARERGDTPTAASMRIEVPATANASVPPTRAASEVGRATAPDADTRLESQIVQALKVQWGAHGGEATIRLQPHYLGELTVSLRVENGSVVAQLAASSPEVRHWIENNEALLRESLSAQDLELERLTVVDEESAQAPSDERAREQEQPDTPRRRARQRDADATFEVVV